MEQLCCEVLVINRQHGGYKRCRREAVSVGVDGTPLCQQHSEHFERQGVLVIQVSDKLYSSSEWDE